MEPSLPPAAVTLPSITLREWDRVDVAGPVEPLRGRRLVLVNASGSHHDYRAWSEVRRSADALVIDAVSEADWWRYVHLAMRPARVLRWPARAAWVEMVGP